MNQIPLSLVLAVFLGVLLPVDCIPAEDKSSTDGSITALEEIVRNIVLTSLPERIQDEDNWGNTKKRPDLSIRFKGLKMKASMNKKQVNHGTWKKLEFWPDNPKEQLTLDLRNLNYGKGFVSFQIVVQIPFRGWIDVQQWVMGAQVLGVRTDISATVGVVFDIHIATSTEGSWYLQKLVLKPKVTKSDLWLENQKVERIGTIRGKAAKEIGDFFERTVKKQLDKQEAKVVQEANKAILKQKTNGTWKVSPSFMMYFIDSK